MEAPQGHSRLSPEVWKEMFAHLPMMWCAMCCRVCKAWQKDLEQTHQGQGDDVLVDYGLATLCCVLATEGVGEVMRRIRVQYPSGIPADLGRMDQVRRFVERHRFAGIESVDEWIQVASQEPDAGWLCKGMPRTKLEGMGKSLMRQAVGKPQAFSRLLDTLTVHSGYVYSVAWSLDGDMIASGSEGRTVSLWSKSGELKGTLRGHSDWVRCVAYSPDGKRIASASDDKTVKVWDAETMEEVGTLKGHSGEVWSVAWNHDGSQLASGSSDCTVRLWTPDGKEKGTLRGHSDWVRCVAYSPDSKTVASASDDGTVKLWDLETMEEKGTLTGHSDDVSCVAYSPDGSTIVTCSWDNTVRLWDAKTMGHKGTLNGHTKDNPECTCSHGTRGYPGCPVRGHFGRVRSVAYSPDSKALASASDGTVKLWDLSCETPVEKGTLKGHRNFVTSVAYSPDSKRIASASGEDTVKIWDAVTMGEVRSVTGHSIEVTCMAWSPDGEFVASASEDEAVHLWSKSGEHRGTMRHSDSVYCVAYSPDGGTIACGGSDNTVRLWDAKTMEHKGTLTGHSGLVFSVAYSPDGRTIASGSGGLDNTVRLWDAKTMKYKGTLRGHSDYVDSVAWSPDGEVIASASEDETVRLWSKSGEHKGTLDESSWQHLGPRTKALVSKVKHLRLTGSFWTGQYIITGYGNMVYVYRTDLEGQKQGEPLACFLSPAEVTAVSCKGTSVVVGCADGQVNLYLLCGANAAVF